MRTVMFKYLLIFFTLIQLTHASLLATPNEITSHKGLPSKLLEAIAMVETGQRSGNSMTPYPWSINVSGKGYVYKTKADAIKAVRAFQAKGFDSIDVGIMQINLKHHPKAFLNLEDAFDLKKNIAYAASFLKALYMKHGNWHMAVKHYHSGNPALNSIYLQKVLKAWARVKAKDFVFGPMNLVHSHEFDMTKLPSEGNFRSEIQTNARKSIPISVDFFPIKMNSSGAASLSNSQSNSKANEIKHESSAHPGAIAREGRVFPIVINASSKPHSRSNKTKVKATPIVLTAADMMPLR